MSLIRKDPNEILYPTGKKTILTIIKNEASPEVILWRVPYEDFNEGSKVIVAENEEALFYKNGVIEASFTGGEYKLETNNYPFLSRIRNFASGGISAYNCRIIYVNKTHQLDNRWGTDGPVQVIDKVYNIPVDMVARGSYTLQIKDAKKFYLKFAGATASLLTASDISDKMRSQIGQKIKTTIAQVVSDIDAEIIGINTRLEEIAEMMRVPMEAVFDEYGVQMVNFYLEALEVVKNETYTKLEQARADAASGVVWAIGKKKEVEALGPEYGRVMTANIMMAAATNPSQGTMGEGMGLGAGIAMGGVMGASAMSVLTPLSSGDARVERKDECDENAGASRFEVKKSPDTITAPCGHAVAEGVKFCPECGKPVCICCSNGHSVPIGSKFCPECGERII